MQRKAFLRIVAAVFALALVPLPASPQSRRPAPEGDVALELVGQVLNTGAMSAQYGYLTHINGIDAIFSGMPQNETTALFTFYNETTTVRVINNGPLRIVNRTGTTTIYLDETPDGNFANPETFRDGTPVMVSTLRHQVILDTTTNQFTTTFVNTITAVENFILGFQNLRLGKVNQKFRTVVFGRPSTAGPAQFVIAGYAVGIDFQME